MIGLTDQSDYSIRHFIIRLFIRTVLFFREFAIKIREFKTLSENLVSYHYQLLYYSGKPKLYVYVPYKYARIIPLNKAATLLFLPLPSSLYLLYPPHRSTGRLPAPLQNDLPISASRSKIQRCDPIYRRQAQLENPSQQKMILSIEQKGQEYSRYQGAARTIVTYNRS